MEIYAFANQKGGHGKTTVTLGIAAALAGSGVRTLVEDLDPHVSATRVVDVDRPVGVRAKESDVVQHQSARRCVHTDRIIARVGTERAIATPPFSVRRSAPASGLGS